MALAAAPEVAFIQFDLSALQEGGILGLTDNGQPDGQNESVNRSVAFFNFLEARVKN